MAKGAPEVSDASWAPGPIVRGLRGCGAGPQGFGVGVAWISIQCQELKFDHAF